MQLQNAGSGKLYRVLEGGKTLPKRAHYFTKEETAKAAAESKPESDVIRFWRDVEEVDALPNHLPVKEVEPGHFVVDSGEVEQEFIASETAKIPESLREWAEEHKRQYPNAIIVPSTSRGGLQIKDGDKEYIYFPAGSQEGQEYDEYYEL